MTSQQTDRPGDFPQRRSYRCGLPARQREAILEAGPRQLTVRLLNESVEGAAVWTDRDPGVKADDVVWLSTTFGRFEARVVHVTQLEPFAGKGSGDRPGFRLGLERLQEPTVPSATVGSGGFFGS